MPSVFRRCRSPPSTGDAEDDRRWKEYEQWAEEEDGDCPEDEPELMGASSDSDSGSETDTQADSPSGRAEGIRGEPSPEPESELNDIESELSESEPEMEPERPVWNRYTRRIDSLSTGAKVPGSSALERLCARNQLARFTGNSGGDDGVLAAAHSDAQHTLRHMFAVRNCP